MIFKFFEEKSETVRIVNIYIGFLKSPHVFFYCVLHCLSVYFLFVNVTLQHTD